MLVAKSNGMNEAEASLDLRSFFARVGWNYTAEAPTASGKYIDYLVEAPHNGNSIAFGVECKPKLNAGLNLTTWADHMEQAVGYSRDLNVPVFVGPYYTVESPSHVYHGGHTVSAASAFCAFGGRSNVGLIVYCSRRRWSRWYLILRGATFWEEGIGFRGKRLSMVKSTGAKRQRANMSVFQVTES